MTIRIFLLTLVLCTNYIIKAQRTILPTESLRIEGKVKNPITFTIASIDTFPETAIEDQVIYNHKGEAKDTLTGLSGVPIKALLSSVQYVYEKPKELNEFYFVFIASDGYKVVFSWNEIYNTGAGDNFFIITEMEGKKLRQLDQRIAFISIADLKAGRRYIKGLARIAVRCVE